LKVLIITYYWPPAVIQLYEDKGLREKLGKNGEDFIKNEFSWEITCQKLLNLYNNLQV